MINQNQTQKKKVAVGLSGGVDSAVSAYLLKEQGYDVTGVYMQCWEVKEDGCAANEDKAYALQTAAKLGIPFESLNFVSQYKERVIDYFFEEYQKGRTPNPDVACNREIKFGLFFDWAMEHGFDYLATGHYARVEEASGQYALKQGVDASKDQSYFLFRSTQKTLAKTIFPVGGLLKKEVRQIAEKNQLPPYKRAESMGICFIGEVDIRKFLEQRIEHKAGEVVDVHGNVIGSHDGVWFYTIGQRHGFKLTKYYGVPVYVVAKEVEANRLVVGPEEEAKTSEFWVEDLHWIVGHAPADFAKEEILVRIRHLGSLQRAHLSFETPSRLRVKAEEPFFAVAPGQSAVFYSVDKVLGGGTITD